MTDQSICTLRKMPDQKALDALLDMWAWRVSSQYLGTAWSVQDFRDTLKTIRVPNGWEVAVVGLDVDPLTLGALSDSLTAFADGFMAGVGYEQGLEYEELQ